MKDLIKKKLKQIEKENNIEIIFAIENGSRAWRIESKDSDYDVRFVFSRPLKDYISLTKAPLVLNYSFDSKGKPSKPQGSLIDISGFDIFKFLELLSNSNPTTIEWLISDIVYLGKQNISLKKYAVKNFNPLALDYHYRSLCRQNYLNYIKTKKNVNHKKYLYAFRGIVNQKYVQNFNSLPMIDFRATLKKLERSFPKDIYAELEKIINIKSSGKEKDRIENIRILDRFIENFLLEKTYVYKNIPKKNIELLNKELQKLVIK